MGGLGLFRLRTSLLWPSPPSESRALLMMPFLILLLLLLLFVLSNLTRFRATAARPLRTERGRSKVPRLRAAGVGSPQRSGSAAWLAFGLGTDAGLSLCRKSSRLRERADGTTGSERKRTADYPSVSKDTAHPPRPNSLTLCSARSSSSRSAATGVSRHRCPQSPPRQWRHSASVLSLWTPTG